MRKTLNQKGQGMTEYILIVALIAVAVIGAVKFFGSSTNANFKATAASVTTNVNQGVAAGNAAP
jgi:pilus assembly protein Flp/PilA